LVAAGAMSDIREYSSVYHAFQINAERFGNNAFLRAPAANTADASPHGVSYTYAETSARVNELIPNYDARGLKKGERVALVFDSRLEVYLHLLALNALGVSIVPLHSLGTDDDLRYMITHSNCRLAVSADEHRGRLESLLADRDDCDVIGESDLMGSNDRLPAVQSDLGTEAAIVYTSGTTGKPKGCMLSNEYFLGLGIWYNGLGGICAMDASDRLLTPLPPNHMNALCTSFTAMMLCGGRVVQLDRFHPSTWWQTVREEKATILHSLGVMIAILLTLPEDDADNFSDEIKFCFGPGPDPRHQALFEKRFGFPLIDAWAMSPAMSVSAASVKRPNVWSTASSTIRKRMLRPANQANYWFGQWATGRAAIFSAVITRIPPRPKRAGAAAGGTLVTSSAKGRTAACFSSTGARTLSAAVARILQRLRSRQPCYRARMSKTAPCAHTGIHRVRRVTATDGVPEGEPWRIKKNGGRSSGEKRLCRSQKA
jgi:acyl-CoA synthetase (AMP-forming)/AMP-acid ligase II